MNGRAPIRVLVADDSHTIRAGLAALLDRNPRLKVVGQAADGVEAVKLAKALRPDVITMDIIMPRLDGLGAIAAIMAEAPSRILVVSAASEEQVDYSFRAMAAGALEVIAKPSQERPEDFEVWGRRISEAVEIMAEVPVVTRKLSSVPLNVGRDISAVAVDAIGIAASTGGPPALALLLSALPEDMPIPIFIAQHIAYGFTDGLVRWFSAVSRPKVVTAEEGVKGRPGVVYLPPDGHDLIVDSQGYIQLPRSPGDPCPSGDKLLASLANAYGNRAGGIVLTGMGSDGARGLLAIRNAGGVTMAQDESSCVVFGMPAAAFQMGATMNMFPLESISQLIRELCERPDKGQPEDKSGIGRGEGA